MGQCCFAGSCGHALVMCYVFISMLCSHAAHAAPLEYSPCSQRLFVDSIAKKKLPDARPFTFCFFFFFLLRFCVFWPSRPMQEPRPVSFTRTHKPSLLQTSFLLLNYRLAQRPNNHMLVTARIRVLLLLLPSMLLVLV